MITPGKAAEYALLRKLVSFTKLPKTEWIKEYAHSRLTHEELPVYRYSVLWEVLRAESAPYFYSVSLTGTSVPTIAQLVRSNKWAKTDIRKAFMDGIEFLNNPTDHYALTVEMMGSVWVVSQAIEQRVVRVAAGNGSEG